MILEETECGIIEKRRDSPRFCFVNYVQLKSLVNFTREKRFPCATSNCFISSEDCKLLLQPSIRNRNSRIIIFKVKASMIPFSFLKKQAIQPFFKHHKQKHFLFSHRTSTMGTHLIKLYSAFSFNSHFDWEAL